MSTAKKTAKKKPKNNKNNDIEKNLEQLEALTERLNRGDLPLNQALDAFEEGMQLAQASEKTLKEAEQRIQELIEKNGATAWVEYERDDD